MGVGGEGVLERALEGVSEGAFKGVLEGVRGCV